MAKTINVLSGNPGVGKTKLFIEGIEHGKRYVYVAPTRKLAQEVMTRLDEVKQTYTPIFTSQTQEVGSVVHLTNKALAAKDSPLLIITHKCLASVKPELLSGWELYVDECLKIEHIETVRVLASEYEATIARYVGDCRDNGELEPNMALLSEAYEIHAQGLEDAKNKRVQNKTLLLVLDAMLSPTKSVVATPSKNDKGKATVTIHVEGFVDFTKPFDYASSVTLMGANVDRGLAAKLAQAKGYILDVVKQKKAPRKGIPIIFPLVRDQDGAYISKSTLLTMPDGSVASEWNAECFGQTVLNTALQTIGNNPTIFASHEWCKPALPYNVERTPFDTRGLNEWRDKHVSIHILHGNPSPDELAPTKRIIEKMGIPLHEGREALRWEREGDALVQFAHRTSVRDENTDGNTYHFVTSETQAKRLSLDFDCSCIIDRALMMEPPARMATEGQDRRSSERGELAMQAKSLKASGLTQKEIAHTLGISQPKVSRLLK